MLKLYNTLTRKKERFRPISDKKVGMYTCGITAYYSAHIGNMRTYVLEDLIKRVLIHDGYDVTHIENVTDVGHLVSDADAGEDKMRLASEKEHRTMRDISKHYFGIYEKDRRLLNASEPTKFAWASEHIPEMLDLIKRLDGKGYIYKAEDGVYYDTSKFKDYGQLTGMKLADLEANLKAGARVEMIKGKRNITDFAVWRFAHGNEKDMIWDSPWGRGFPGWHIECSAMSMKYLGDHFDIHCGGIDHIPIHHTNEIAQSDAAAGHRVVNVWMHMNFLVVENTKMSKSLRNIYTVQEIFEKGYLPLSLRLFYISGHYRQQLNFTFEALDNTEKTLKGVYAFLERLSEVKNAGKNEDGAAFRKIVSGSRKAFFKALDDDINVPNALAAMHSIINETNARIAGGKLNRAEAKAVMKAMLEFDLVLGLDFARHAVKKTALDAEIQKLVDAREEARRTKDFRKADSIRNMLKEKYSILLEDTPDGVRWHRE